MVMAGAMVAGAAAAAAAILALMTTTQHDRLGEECDAVVAPAAQECAVCLCELAGAAGCSEPEAAAAAVRTLPGCGHGFHAECIGRWLPLRAECPICRRPVVTGADGQAPVAVAEAAAAAAAAPAWSRAARMACEFGDGRVVWTRSPSA
uniref:RING-type domain-containing protein n=1 Tax=Oryza glumipatula TaxID=40148 RepID=A0A0D9Z8J1_9ORYZ